MEFKPDSPYSREIVLPEKDFKSYSILRHRCAGHKYVGQCLIFDCVRFDPKSGLDARPGSSVDSGFLKETFEGMNFMVEIYEDKSKREILSYLQQGKKCCADAQSGYLSPLNFRSNRTVKLTFSIVILKLIAALARSSWPAFFFLASQLCSPCYVSSISDRLVPITRTFNIS